MAVMEIHLPSGFVVDTDTLPTLESSERIKVRQRIGTYCNSFHFLLPIDTESGNAKTQHGRRYLL